MDHEKGIKKEVESLQDSSLHGHNGNRNYISLKGIHCLPSSLQGYVNGSYPFTPSHLPHHRYNSHQILPNDSASYQGSYSSRQNQKEPSNQRKYRGHHSGYVCANHYRVLNIIFKYSHQGILRKLGHTYKFLAQSYIMLFVLPHHCFLFMLVYLVTANHLLLHLLSI